MSCSQFIEHEDEDKSDTLVIIVNGDGTVTVDPLTLERVLSQQRRAAVSVIRFENTDEPDSQSEKVQEDVKIDDKPCRKVNLVIEGYYPSSSNVTDKTTESIVSSTVSTPPLPQTTNEFLDLLSEGLNIPVNQSPTPSNMHTTASDGCIGDSLVDAFSEMAPEQLKQVETALHSEKAKQILGDDVTSVLDTLQLNEGQDDWVHLDHCYTNIYGSKKHNQTERVPNVVVQDSDVATMLTIKVGASDDQDVSKEDSTHSIDTSNSNVENFELNLPENTEDVEDSSTLSDADGKKKIQAQRSKVIGKGVLAKGNPSNVKDTSQIRKERPIVSTPKPKRKSKESTSKEIIPERIVTEDEVDGVKVFKPTRNDKRSIKPLLYRDGLLPPKPLVQSKLNFGKKDVTDKVEKPVTTESKADQCKLPKKSTPAEFGPALFSTPDIIRKINADDLASPEEKLSITDDQTAEIEKRMSALENGEAILDQLHLQVEMQKEMERISQSDDDKLLSDLENSADEEPDISAITSQSYETSKNLDTDSEPEYSPKKSSNGEKAEGEYEDDPNKLWCLCNKPHNNRFMICCDACDNWFHGYCVGITKAMGEKMEKNGTEWLCPSCKKEKSAKMRENKFEAPTRSTASRLASRHGFDPANSTISSSNASMNDSSSSATPADHPANVSRRKSYGDKSEKATVCVECKENEASSESAYCSNNCLLNHVTNSLNKMNSGQRLPLSDDRRIVVWDRKNDHRITGLRAPSVGNLREWLLQHPTYEIVRPSALPMSRDDYPTVAKVVPKKIPKPKSSPPIKEEDGMMQVSMKQFLVKKPAEDVNAMKMKIKRADDIANITIKDVKPIRKEDPRKEKQRQIKLIPVQPLSKPEEQKEKVTVPVVKKPPPPPPPPKKKIELPKEKVIPKKVEIKKPEVKKKEPESPANPTANFESARAAVRKSLRELFNNKIKESKDIKMNEEEAAALAGQVEEELFAIFRDNVSKYKTKYRSLHFNIKQPQNTLFQRIVEKSLSPHELVRLTPQELACTELALWRQREAKHEIDMIKKTELENLNQAKVLVVKTHKGELEIESETLPPCKTDLIVPDLQPEEVPEEKDKKKTMPYYFNKDKERSAKKEDRDKDRDKHKRDHKDKHKSRKHRHRSAERDKHGRRSDSPKSRRSRSRDKDRKKRRSRSRSRKKEKTPERVETIDKEEVPAELLNPFKSVDVDLSDMEPTSTVTIKTPPHAHSPETPSCVWKGMVTMPEVVKFHTMLKEVSGNCEGLDEDLQSVVDCVGRIHPDTVWDYISKVKKSGSKEILVLRFDSNEGEDRNSYFSLYSYLSCKNRMAVVGNAGPAIKDFYVMPLASHSPVPQVLLPLDGPGFDDYRPHLLLAIIVRSRRKKYPTVVPPVPKKMEHEPYVPPVVPVAPAPTQDSFTPPHSPTSVFVNTQVPITTTMAKNDEDEPYSPEDDEPYSPGAIDVEEKLEDSSVSQADDNKQDNINSTAHNDGEHPELYSPSEDFFNDIESSEVTLPADLQKLLNSFKNRNVETSGTILETDPIVDAYKKSAESLDDEDEIPEAAYSPPTAIEDDTEKEPEKEAEVPEIPEIPEVPEETKTRDPRRKADTFRTPSTSQPPPPGMEDEFSPNKSEAMETGGYTTQMPTYGYPASQSIPPYTAMMPQMYLPAGSVYPQTTIPFTAMPPPQIYVPPLMHRATDPSLIPLPAEDTKKSDKRKADDEKETDDDKKDKKKHKSYYTSDSKNRGDSRSPTRHHGSSYDSHRRGYQRDDEYSSRYSHKYRSYRDRGDRNDRGGYWKSGSEYSSHKKYPHSDRDRSSSKRSRWDSSKHEHEDWDEEMKSHEKKDKDYKKSESKH